MTVGGLFAWLLLALLCVVQFVAIAGPAAMLITGPGGPPLLIIGEALNAPGPLLGVAVAIAAAVLLGTPAALALWRRRASGLAAGLIAAPLLVSVSLLAQGDEVESLGIMLVGQASRGLAIGALCGLASLASTDPAVLRAAACCGVSPLGAVRRVLLPMMPRGILAGALLAALAALGTSTISILRGPPVAWPALPSQPAAVWIAAVALALALGVVAAISASLLRRR